MDEIKEILGSDHVIFRITQELDDDDENLDILEKIGNIIDDVDNIEKNNGKNKDTNNDKDKDKDKDIARDKGIIDVEKFVINDPKISETQKLQNPFKKNQISKIGWTDWIRSFVIYKKQEQKKDLIKSTDYELSYEELQSTTRNRSTLPRLVPEPVVPIGIHGPKQIIFGGCAGMYHYFLGIAHTLQERFKMDDVVFGCVSGGSFPALALILNLPIKDLHETWNKEILRELNNSPLRAFSRLNNIIFDKSRKYIPADAHIRAKDRLFISITEFPSLNNHIVHYWQSLDSLLACIQASCFIPIFDTRFWTIFDQNKYVDGSLSNNKPIPYPEEQQFIYLTTNKWRQIPLHWYWCYTSESWSDQLFTWGVEDTLAHLDEFYDLGLTTK